MWFLAQNYLAQVHNLSANRQINWKIPEQVSRGGTPDISHILMFYWFEPVLYLDPVSKFPETTERPGYFVGFAENVGDALTFKILKNDLTTVLHRSVVRSAADASHRNKRVQFKADAQETRKKLDTRPGITSKNNHPRTKTNILKDDISTRTRSKSSQVDQNVGITTISKVQGTCNLNVQGFAFPLHDLIPLNDQRVFGDKVVQKGTSECKIYHSVLMNSKSKFDFDRLRNLHI